VKRLLAGVLAAVVAFAMPAGFLASDARAASERPASREAEQIPPRIWFRVSVSGAATPYYFGSLASGVFGRGPSGGSPSLSAIAVSAKVWTVDKLLVEAFTSGWLCPNFGFHSPELKLRSRGEVPTGIPAGTVAVFSEATRLVRVVYVSAPSKDGRMVVACGTWVDKPDAQMARLAMLWQLRTIVPEVLGAQTAK
jgi:hypothetical protein